MALNTLSKFYYGHTITLDNQNIPFIEDGDAANRIAVLNVGSYTLTDFVTEIARAMNATGNQIYTVSVDRSTRVITIESDTRFFNLLVTDPEYTEISVFELMGYTLDKTNLLSYSGDAPSGKVFEPQFKLQEYIDFQDDQKANQVTVNQSASGKVEVVKYGNINLATFDIVLQTNIPQGKNGAVKNDPKGEDNLREFMQYITTKASIELMKDVSNNSDFTKCFLESTPTDKTGTGFILKEMYSKIGIGWWQTGKLKFRKLD